jgi:superfamily II RNA helicase
MRLYEINQKFQQIWDMVSDDESDLELLENCLQSMEGELEEKAENMAKMIKSLEADEKAIKEEEDRLKARRKAFENRREGMKNWLEANLIQMGIDKVKCSTFTVSIQNNPQSVNVIDQKLIPKKYFTTPEPELRKKDILEDLKAGVVVPGAEIQQTKGIRIR